MLNSLFIDLGKSVVIIALFFGLLSCAVAFHAWRHNKTKMKAIAPLKPWDEVKSVCWSPVGLGVAVFALCTSMYAAESLAGVLVVGLVYPVFFILFFKKG